jgi:GntR family transcriptional regulator, rspAB operon transcriptional repressor
MTKTPPTKPKAPPPRRRMARQSKDLVDTIRSMIVGFELPPGAVVSEAQLVKQLGAGRTPVREALLILAQEYLVKQVPGMGSTIAGLDIAEYALITELQEGLEPFAARLAAERITEAEVLELDSILDGARAAARAGDVDQVSQLNLRFHESVLAATHNRYVVDAGMRINRYSIRFWRFAYARGVSMTLPIEEHARIVEALRKHDPDEAQRVAYNHWADALSRLWVSV